jgi:hypothetical protein
MEVAVRLKVTSKQPSTGGFHGRENCSSLLPERRFAAGVASPRRPAVSDERYRKMIETTGSLLERLLPKSIHAVTARGFELKVALFCLACSINCICNG